MRLLLSGAVALLLASPALAQQATAVSPALVERYVQTTWPSLPAEWAKRVEQDQTQQQCSVHRNAPPQDLAEAIVERERASIVLPADGKLVGDWKKGEKLAQIGTGGQFTDGPNTARGGNCFACHQLDPKELSFGTLGPSLTGYGRLRNFAPEAAREAFIKVYNPQATLACSQMPRFGHNGFLTPEQIRDVVAYLVDPASPVNK